MLFSDVSRMIPGETRLVAHLRCFVQSMLMLLLSDQFHCRLPRCRHTDRFSKEFAIAGHDSYLAASTASSYIKQFFLHRICGDDDIVHGFALAAMGCDGIAMCELAIVGGNSSAIFQADRSLVHRFHLHQLSVRGAKIRISTVCSKHYAVAAGNFDGSAFVNRESAYFLW